MNERLCPKTQPSSEDGFTVIELVFVLILMGLIFSLALPNLSGITPRYRMRSYARQIAAAIEEMRVMAISQGRLTGLRYVLSGDKQYFQCLGPAPLDFPDLPLSERKSNVRYEVPEGVRIRGVYLPGGQGGLVSSDVLEVPFSPNGTSGSHIVILEILTETGDSPILSVKFNSISGILDYYNTEAYFQHHET